MYFVVVLTHCSNKKGPPIQSHVCTYVPRKKGKEKEIERERRSERDPPDKAEFIITRMVPNTHIESKGRSLEKRGKEREINVQNERRKLREILNNDWRVRWFVCWTIWKGAKKLYLDSWPDCPKIRTWKESSEQHPNLTKISQKKIV